MAMTNAERQAKYRRTTRERTEGYTARLNTEILHGAKSALKRLAAHHGLTQREMLEQLIISADDEVCASLNDEEHELYLSRVTQ